MTNSRDSVAQEVRCVPREWRKDTDDDAAKHKRMLLSKDNVAQKARSIHVDYGEGTHDDVAKRGGALLSKDRVAPIASVCVLALFSITVCQCL